MKVDNVIIHNYKSICSEVEECNLRLDRTVTFLIGANESGKTNILEAMLKFSTGGFEKNDIPYMSSWRRRSNIPNELPMVSATYVIDERDKKELQKIHPMFRECNEITFRRNYKGEPYIVKPDVKLDKDLAITLDVLKAMTNDASNATKKYLRNYRRKNKRSGTHTGSVVQRLRSFMDVVGVLDTSVGSAEVKRAERKLERLRSSVKSLSDSIPDETENLLLNFEDIGKKIKEFPVFIDAKKVSSKVWNIIPKFELVPVNPKLWLEGRHLVEDILEKPETDVSFMSVRRLLELAELEVKDVLDLPLEMQTPELERASGQTTSLLRKLWEQEPEIEVKLQWSPAEGNKELYIKIKTEGYEGFPQYRSLGFRWFLELYLLYATAAKRDVILLFEEPGIYLHPNAQDFLKTVIRDSVAKLGQVVYTTHLPNMYDSAFPEGCRAVKKDKVVTTVDDKYDSKQRVTWEVAMQALGVRYPSIMMCRENILTEGPSDWIYLQTFARLLAEEDNEIKDIASGIVHIHPCQGAKSVIATVPFFMQEGVRSIVLLDNDQAGENAKKKIEEQYKLPNEHFADIVTVNDVIDIKDMGEGKHEIEDLFGAEFYASLVSDWLETGKLDKNSIKGTELIAKQAKDIVKNKWNRKLEKFEIAWLFHDIVQKGEKAIPEDIKQRFKNLIFKLVEGLRIK